MLKSLALALLFIMGGEPVKDDEPIAATTVMVVDGDTLICTGSMLTPDIILTAAHCVVDKKSQLKIGFGLSADDVKEFREVTGWAVHPRYKLNAAYDIALLIMESEAPEGYAPVVLPDPDGNLKEHVNKWAHVAGYGITSVKPDGGSGNLLFTKVKMTWLVGKTGIGTDESQGHGTCRGDSGGPLYHVHGEDVLLLGLTSRGATSCNFDGIYTSTQRFDKFMNKARLQLYEKYGEGRGAGFSYAHSQNFLPTSPSHREFHLTLSPLR